MALLLAVLALALAGCGGDDDGEEPGGGTNQPAETGDGGSDY